MLKCPQCGRSPQEHYLVGSTCKQPGFFSQELYDDATCALVDFGEAPPGWLEAMRSAMKSIDDGLTVLGSLSFQEVAALYDTEKPE